MLAKEETARTKQGLIGNRTFVVALLLAMFFFGIVSGRFSPFLADFSIELRSAAGGILDFSNKQGFSAQTILLEGLPIIGSVDQNLVEEPRIAMLRLAFRGLTGVDINDPRTFFALHYPLSNNQSGGVTAYNPADPEKEGPILELIPESEPTPLPPNLPVDPGEARAAIYTTHNSESYIGDGGSDHETGKNGEIMEVAATLADSLQKDGLPVVRSDKINDAPNILQAYSHSAKIVNQFIKNNPQLGVVLDVHRDGLPSGKGKRVVQLNGQPGAPVMIVLGTRNPNWRKNEAFAKALLAEANKRYPGLFLSIYYASDARYNQHYHQHALLLEFGDQYNTTAEAERSAQAVAEVLAKILAE